MHRLPGLAARQALHFAKGEWLCRWGDECTGVYLLERGAVKLAYHAPCGRQKVLTIVRTGESFGEATLFFGSRWLVSARALADCTVLHVARRRLAEALAEDAGLARRMLARVSQQLARLRGEVALLGARSGSERLVAYLLAHTGEDTRGPVEVALARKADVASRLGMSPEHLSRVLGKLASAGLIEVRGRRVRVNDPAKLARAPI
jgi:CRP-like cAMP-binding protein